MHNPFKEYFSGQGQSDDLGLGGLGFLFWVLTQKPILEIGILILPFVFLAYNAEKKYIVAAVISYVAFVAYSYYHAEYLWGYKLIFTLVFFGRDMFYLWRNGKNIYPDRKTMKSQILNLFMIAIIGLAVKYAGIYIS